MDKDIKRVTETINKYENIPGLTRRDLRFALLEAGYPSEVVYRIVGGIDKLWTIAIKIGDMILKIGKAIIKAVLSFIKKHPGVAIGIALGAAFASFIGSFVGWIPIIGDLLQDIINAVSIVIGGLVFKSLDEPLREVMSLMEEFAKDLFDALRELRNNEKVEVVYA